jgi:hypothetical protein
MKMGSVGWPRRRRCVGVVAQWAAYTVGVVDEPDAAVAVGTAVLVSGLGHGVPHPSRSA